MSPWQVARQLRSLLLAATWPDGVAARVFGSVLVTQAPNARVMGSLRFPAALIRVGGGASDDQDPRLTSEAIEVTLFVSVPGDALGEIPLLGGPRAGGVGASGGRGLLEVEEILLGVVAKIGGDSGVRLRVASKGRGQVQGDGVQSYIMARGYVLEAWTTSARSYPRPENLVATPAGGGVVNLSWSLPPSRFDRLQVVLRRAAGATAPTSATDGTGVTLASALATSVSDSPGAGTFSYALFAGYDETSATPTTTDRWSISVTRLSVVVT